jgi:hypothetical protein
MIDYDEMRAFQVHEETGELPDEVYSATAEDGDDPDSWEIAKLVMEQYALTNEQRRDCRARRRISVLEQALIEHGIEIPE